MSTQETKLKDIADAIRAKEGSFDPIIANDFPARIAAIQTGTDTSDATATAGDILSGETAYVASGKVTGTIPTKTESNISVSGPTIIVPSGYYGSQISKSIATATQATPTISVNSSGLITASSTQSAGYVTAGTKSATRQLTTQTGKTITPGRTQQTAVSSGRYTTGNVYVAGDTDLVAANIKKGINIFGVAGTYEGRGLPIGLQFASTSVTNTKVTLSNVGIGWSTTLNDVASIFLFVDHGIREDDITNLGYDRGFIGLNVWRDALGEFAGAIEGCYINSRYGFTVTTFGDYDASDIDIDMSLNGDELIIEILDVSGHTRERFFSDYDYGAIVTAFRE